MKEPNVKIVRQSHKCLFIKISDYYKGSIGNVVNITLRRHNRFISFIALVKRYHTSYGINIPEFIVKNHRINLGENVQIEKIQKIEPLIPSESLVIKRNEIDLLSLIPEVTRKKQKIYLFPFDRNNEKWLRLWYRKVNIQMELRRYVNLDRLGSLLGQLQAEGVKFKNEKTPFLSFTNILISEHHDFINSLRSLGIPNEMIVAQCSFNPKIITWDDIENRMREFMKVTGIPIKTSVHQKIGKFKFRVYVYSALLAEILLNGMDRIRKMLTDSSKIDRELKNLAKNFISKLLTGDGTLRIYKYKRNGRFSHNISGKISDKDPEYRVNYVKILQNLGFNTREDGVNLVYFSCRLKDLLFMYKIKAFKGTNNWYKLLRAIKIHCEGKTLHGKSLFRLTKLILNEDGVFTLSNLCGFFNCSHGTVRTWLFKMRKHGYIKKMNNHYLLTTKGKKIGDLLACWSTELNEIRV